IPFTYLTFSNKIICEKCKRIILKNRHFPLKPGIWAGEFSNFRHKICESDHKNSGILTHVE
ncbi:hypothetical protein Q7C09_12865, partial [Heyndrickxia coagulans]|uniref:hypothetical protein n=1 Tax=Heyndrickxia coagulans TaxID=1398 RepID=UPI0028125B8F